ncbi:MAG TPA: nitrilase-related carbon-nitrogen hydrolase, partial [Candidatus Brocadiia bacterium]|nr:nitrilase-related carbon-nitrogen hydrolase [Candidatus Brocadiia bacterium]
MKIALAQINPTIADFDGNTKRILDRAQQAKDAGARLAVFPEMCVLGYPARDLVEKRSIIAANLDALQAVAARAPLPMLVGFLGRNETGHGRRVHNSAAFIADGAVRAVVHKRLLPTYDVFDEDRYFEPGPPSKPVVLDGRRLGVTICEDAWAPVEKRHPFDPVADLCAQGVDAIINLSASPFSAGKRQVKLDLFSGHAKRHAKPLLMCNQVGGNDELIFDGGSMVFDAQGRLVAESPCFEEDLLIVDLDRLPQPIQPATMTDPEAVYHALVLGIRDYLRKCGFSKAVLGLSGGIDSALVAALAAHALGPENVLGVSMPSRFSSQHSRDDARAVAANLGIGYRVIPIEPAHKVLLEMLAPAFEGRQPDTTEE